MKRKLLFLNYDYLTGIRSLWVSDATANGTHAIKDDDLTNVTQFYDFTAIGNSLYFEGYTDTYGYELYTADASATMAKPADNINGNIIAAKIQSKLEARLLNNPIRNQLSLSITSVQQQNVSVVISNSAGKIIQVAGGIVAGGNNTVSYNTSTWAAGVYWVKIVGADRSAITIKALKEN